MGREEKNYVLALNVMLNEHQHSKGFSVLTITRKFTFFAVASVNGLFILNKIR